MKTISFELAERLNNDGLLDNIETEYKYTDYGELINIKFINTDFYKSEKFNYCDKFYKALTFEEAIEFLKNKIGVACDFSISNRHNIDWYISLCFESPEPNLFFEGETLIEAIEKMIEYLLDNNLLGK